MLICNYKFISLMEHLKNIMRTSIRVITIVSSFLTSYMLYSCGLQNIDNLKIHNTEVSKHNPNVIKGRVELPEINSAKGFSIKAQVVNLLNGATVTLKYPYDHPTKANKIISTTVMNDYNFEIPLGPEFNTPMNDVMVIEVSKRLLGRSNKLITLQTYVKRLPEGVGGYNNSNYYPYELYYWNSIYGNTYEPIFDNINKIFITLETTAISIISRYKGISSEQLSDLITLTNSRVNQYLFNHPDPEFPQYRTILENMLIEQQKDPASVAKIAEGYSTVSTFARQSLQNLQDPMSLIKYDETQNFYYIDQSYIKNKLLAEGECKGCNLREQAYENLNIPNIDFTKADLIQTSFSGTTINNGNFEQTNLLNTIFIESEISKSVFNRVSLKNTDFSGSLITDTKFSNIHDFHVMAANFSGTLLNKIIIENCIGVFQLNFKDSKIDNLLFTNPDTYQGNIITDMSPRVFNLNFRKSEMLNSSFDKVFLSEVDFSDSKITSTIFLDTVLEACNFYNTNIKDSEFTNSKLTNINFLGFKIATSKFNNVSFINCNLKGVNFQGSEFNNVSFDGSDLSGAIWTDGRICATGSIGVCN